MNLLTEKWIPVLRAHGEDIIAPYEITDIDNPVLSLNASRADFNGALIQFLIGLLQTTRTDLKNKQWRQWLQKPPTPEELKQWFKPLEKAFEFDGNTARFMQDFNLPEGEPKSVSALFIEQPGQQTLEMNADHFIKRNSITQVCIHCAATALFTLQINAPGGGAGHRTSLRGGGPLTTLVISKTEEKQLLWNMLWLNVLTEGDFKNYTNSESLIIDRLEGVFPWLAPTRISEKESGGTYPQDAHPFQMYWCMPRRIRLNFENTIAGKCDVCGKAAEKLLQQYITKNYGINYLGSWRHSLSPYRSDENKLPIPLHPQRGGIGYKYWQAITLEDPASVIKALKDQEPLPVKVWAFGYDMDNMKARCWYESTMPFYYIKPEIQEKFTQDGVAKYFEATKQALKFLYFALKDTNVHIKTAETNFWQTTESCFYEALEETVNILNEDASADLKNIKEKWLRNLQNHVLTIFDRYADLTHAEISLIQRLVIAKNKLLKNLHGKSIRNNLGLEAKGVTK